MSEWYTRHNNGEHVATGHCFYWSRWFMLAIEIPMLVAALGWLAGTPERDIGFYMISTAAAMTSGKNGYIGSSEFT